MKVLIDSSAFISLLVSNQVTNKKAVDVYQELKQSPTTFYTSNLILNESYTWLLYKNGLRIAKGLNEMVTESEKAGYLKIFWIDDILWQETWVYFMKFAEHQLSFTDAFSYLLVKKFRLDGIFTFDNSFRKVGLKTYP